MEVCNVKFHCTVLKKHFTTYYRELYKTDLAIKRFPSFCVLRFQGTKFVFNCYYTGYLNVTGVRNLEGISVALDVLCHFLNLPQNVFGNVTVDNISARCNKLSHKCVILQEKKLRINHEEIKSIKYRREVFPNMFIKTDYGTIIWSAKNRVTCVGIKKEQHLTNLLSLICQIDAA